jgi:glycosyltransferase involved in cell wall biosynthesis
MAAGAAVLGADIGGIPESTREAGLVFPAEDAAALAGLVEGLADDDRLLADVRRRCRAYAEAHDWASVHHRLDEVLAELDAA